MKVKQLIDRLKGLDKNDSIQFYFLENYNLEGCELETIIEVDERVEITIKPYFTDNGGNSQKTKEEL